MQNKMEYYINSWLDSAHSWALANPCEAYGLAVATLMLVCWKLRHI